MNEQVSNSVKHVSARPFWDASKARRRECLLHPRHRESFTEQKSCILKNEEFGRWKGHGGKTENLAVKFSVSRV